MKKNSIGQDSARRSFRTCGLFAGIGGIELGLQRQGHHPVLLVDNNQNARSVLSRRFPGVSISDDVRSMKKLPGCDLVAAGFPCQNLSQCGKTDGISGTQSSLVCEVFRLIENTSPRPNWVLLENVPFMLRLDAGRAMQLITDELVRLGYKWAYRTVNARAFGLPQRRLRVVIVASRCEDPNDVLFSDNADEAVEDEGSEGYGFYWTEGRNGLGWAPNCVPTLKCGSTLGIPSPPAVWIPSERKLATIDIRDAERLQGFPVNWTKSSELEIGRGGTRWRLIGNAVCVKMSHWIGRRLASPTRCVRELRSRPLEGQRWPNAACGDEDGAWEVSATTWPVSYQQTPILSFLRFPLLPLSERATAGFFSRVQESKLKFDSRFLSDVEFHLRSIKAG